jgi:hypothetical protein
MGGAYHAPQAKRQDFSCASRLVFGGAQNAALGQTNSH